MYYYKYVINEQVIGVEAKSVNSISPNFVTAKRVEYDDFIASLPSPLPPEPTRDLAAEIDKLRARVDRIEATSPLD